MNNKTAESKTYDLAIIGTGPAGYTASIYASRYKLSNIIIGERPGGQAAEAHLIQNFPSYKEIGGMELTNKFREHAESYGVKIVNDKVTDIQGEFCGFTLTTSSGKEFQAKAILLAIGTKRRKLGLPNEEKLFGKGVTYCATCDAPFYQGKTVAVVGGSDSANTASIYLAEIAEKVYQIYRKDKLRGEPAWTDEVTSHPKISILYNTNITEIIGGDRLEAVALDQPYDGKGTLKIDGLFIEIGSEPDTNLMEKLGLDTDKDGRIIINPDQTTNVPGVWSAGDISTGSNNFHQTITAAAEGAIASENVFTTLHKK